MPFKFEKLEVWKEAVELSNIVHDISKKFPKDELYILTPQIKRATDSISLNIAEGSTGSQMQSLVNSSVTRYARVLSW